MGGHEITIVSLFIIDNDVEMDSATAWEYVPVTVAETSSPTKVNPAVTAVLTLSVSVSVSDDPDVEVLPLVTLTEIAAPDTPSILDHSPSTGSFDVPGGFVVTGLHVASYDLSQLTPQARVLVIPLGHSQ